MLSKRAHTSYHQKHTRELESNFVGLVLTHWRYTEGAEKMSKGEESRKKCDEEKTRATIQ